MSRNPKGIRPMKPNSTNTATPLPAPQSQDGDLEVKTYTVRMLKRTAIKTALDLTYNEIALKQLLLQVELEIEDYHLKRLSIMREAMTRDKSAAIESKENASQTPGAVAQPIPATETEPTSDGGLL